MSSGPDIKIEPKKALKGMRTPQELGEATAAPQVVQTIGAESGVSIRTVKEARAQHTAHTQLDGKLSVTLEQHRKVLGTAKRTERSLNTQNTTTNIADKTVEPLEKKSAPAKSPSAPVKKSLLDLIRSSNPDDTIIDDLVNAIDNFLKKLARGFTRERSTEDLDLQDPNKVQKIKVVSKRKKKKSALKSKLEIKKEKTGFYNIDSAREEEDFDSTQINTEAVDTGAIEKS